MKADKESVRPQIAQSRVGRREFMAGAAAGVLDRMAP